MRILFIGETQSIHLARWVNQLWGTDWDVHVFQAGTGEVTSALMEGVVHLREPRPVPEGCTARLTANWTYWTRNPVNLAARLLLRRPVPLVHKIADHLVRVIDEVRPDIIHSHGLNLAWRNLCLPVLQARERLGRRFTASWVYSSYGQDLSAYAQMSPQWHAEVTSILPACDYYVAECDRDARLATEMGFQGDYLGILPAFGGVDLDHMASMRRGGPPGQRRLIYLKGADNSGGPGDPVGSVMTAMRGLEQAADDLNNVRVVVGQLSGAVTHETPVLWGLTGINIRALPECSIGAAPRHAILRLIGASRAMIGCTGNDGLASTLVEAMSLGALPVYSRVEPITDWIVDGENGLLASPDDPDEYSRAIQRAVHDDDLVNNAAIRNKELVREHLSDEVVRPKVIAMYERVHAQGPTRPR